MTSRGNKIATECFVAFYDQNIFEGMKLKKKKKKRKFQPEIILDGVQKPDKSSEATRETSERMIHRWTQALELYKDIISAPWNIFQTSECCNGCQSEAYGLCRARCTSKPRWCSWNRLPVASHQQQCDPSRSTTSREDVRLNYRHVATYQSEDSEAVQMRNAEAAL